MARPSKPTPDPLADLRPSTDAPPPGPTEDEGAGDDNLTPEPMRSQAWHDAHIPVIVAAWHADPTSHGFVHHGGTCGCRYLARSALQAAMGAPYADEPEQDEGGDDGTE